MTSVSVITPALPTRITLLEQAIASVNAQTHKPVEHLIGFDHRRDGTAAMKNALARAARCDWVATLEDDDQLDPTHLHYLVMRIADADIVYSWCRVEGRDGWCPNRTFNADELRKGNYIPSTALIRRSLIENLGGWKDSSECENGWEDWNFWLRALDVGGRFVCVPSITWTYCYHGGNKTLRGEQEAF